LDVERNTNPLKEKPMAKPKVARCAKSCKGKTRGKFRKCVKKCVRKGKTCVRTKSGRCRKVRRKR